MRALLKSVSEKIMIMVNFAWCCCVTSYKITREDHDGMELRSLSILAVNPRVF